MIHPAQPVWERCSTAAGDLRPDPKIRENDFDCSFGCAPIRNIAVFAVAVGSLDGELSLTELIPRFVQSAKQGWPVIYICRKYVSHHVTRQLWSKKVQHYR